MPTNADLIDCADVEAPWVPIDAHRVELGDRVLLPGGSIGLVVHHTFTTRAIVELEIDLGGIRSEISYAQGERIFVSNPQFEIGC